MTDMDNSSQVDIAIVGGGMVGLSLALMLSKTLTHSNIVIIEGLPFTQTRPQQASFDARNTAVSAGSVTLLKQLGIWHAIEASAHACAISEVQVSDRGHVGWANYQKQDNQSAAAHAEQGEALGYVVENTCLGRHLLQAVNEQKNIRCLAPATVTQFVPRASGAELEYEYQGQIHKMHTELVVLADGANSPLAVRAGIQFDTHDYGQRAIIANVTHQQAHDGCAFERFTESGPLALLPMPHVIMDGHNQNQPRSALVWTHPEAQADKYLEYSDTAFLAELQQRFGYGLGRFTGVGERKTYSLNLVFAREQARRNLVLVGNAAHFLHPVAGQGFNLALRDCDELALCLSQAQLNKHSIGELDVLQDYVARREQDQWLTTQLSHQFIDMFASTNPIKRVARNVGLSAVNHVKPLKSLFFEHMMGLGTLTANVSTRRSSANI